MPDQSPSSITSTLRSFRGNPSLRVQHQNACLPLFRRLRRPPLGPPRLQHDNHRRIMLLRLLRSAPVLLIFPGSTSASSIWHIDIFQGPAPPPELGPPFSASARRDRSLLLFEILAILGAYSFCVIVVGIFILTVGRRARKRARDMAAADRPREMMVKPWSRTFDPSPISPASNRSWYKMRSAGKHATPSVSSFDSAYIEADRRRRQEEMQDLYAAVMAHDDQRSSGSAASPPPPAAAAPTSPPRLVVATSPTDTRSPARSRPAPLVFGDPALRHLQSTDYPASPKSPVRAIYPPDRDLPDPRAPTSPIRADPQSSRMPAFPLPPPPPPAQSDHRTPSLGSRRRRHNPLRNLTISAPIRPSSPDDDEARTPLSPLSPSHNNPPTTTADTTPSPAISDLDEIRALPHPHPQRDRTSPPRATTTRTLPLRVLRPSTAAGPVAPTPTNTTFIPLRRDRMPGGALAVPSAGLATPYSPYMPFTPLTPVTPHLTSRAERRQRQREERALGPPVVMEEDRVEDESAMWGAGY